MAAYAIIETVAFTTTSCASCGVQFAMPSHLERERRETGKEFFCPNGHTFVYKSEIERLKKEIEAQRAARASAEVEANAQRVLREKAERKLRRVEKGVCPECRRNFTNLRRHMETKHAHAAPEAKTDGR